MNNGVAWSATAERLSKVWNRRYHTTGSVAALCGVAPRTVSMWCDTGMLPSYKIPTAPRMYKTKGNKKASTGDRRILREDLYKFCSDKGMENALRLLRPRALLLGDVPPLTAAGVTVDSAPTPWAGGRAFGEWSPAAVVVIDLGSYGRQAAVETIADVKKTTPAAVTVVLMTEDNCADTGPWVGTQTIALMPPHAPESVQVVFDKVIQHIRGES